MPLRLARLVVPPVLLALAACSGGAVAPPPLAGAARTVEAKSPDQGVPGQVLSVTPTALRFTAIGQTACVRTMENFSGSIASASENPAVATAGPAGEPDAVVPGAGGTKFACFTVTAAGAGTTFVDLTDKKGNLAQVLVTVVLPTPVPSATPPGICPAATARATQGRRLRVGIVGC